MASAMEGNNAIAARLAPQVRITDQSATAPAEEARVRFDISNLDFFYGSKQAVFCLHFKISANKITALIGPSRCGKLNFLPTPKR